MSFSRNWIGHVISQGERFVVQYLDRTFGGRIRRVFEVDQSGVTVEGDASVSGILTAQAASASVAGLQSVADFNKLATVPAGQAIYSVTTTAPIDLMATTTGVIQIIPSIPGFTPTLVETGLFALSGSGTATTGITWQAGNDAGESNIVKSTATSTAVINAAIAAGFPCLMAFGSTPFGANAKQLLNLSTPVTLKITIAAAGTATLTGYVFTRYSIVPV